MPKGYFLFCFGFSESDGLRLTGIDSTFFGGLGNNAWAMISGRPEVGGSMTSLGIVQILRNQVSVLKPLAHHPRKHAAHAVMRIELTHVVEAGEFMNVAVHVLRADLVEGHA